ncbi:TerC family protein [Candidatus Poribacteria bacterium]|jgi:YkoY family integral membrane protein|nr:TerC family protein [Candidatus Poribacteria bacterium]MBT5531867.1 TerC family protein [Candidatus Poribacteria bacterium]MBT5714022.1 TerC family protein [Candidatus Poribacteria bacterium]MBT7101877.1 TerC family protein [Candidatus Poribacteria bacterium]MBT7804587.1 TerC family protein [Candidatus Poribacteria bacterium]
MLGQQFAGSDIPTVIALVFLEGLLSADNALVLAILVQGLPKHQQKKGLLYGLAGAWILRGICIVFASLLMRFWWIEAAGAAYLLYLAVKHFTSHRGSADGGGGAAVRRFWPTIIIVELTDLAFAVDSILAAVGLVGARPEKIWVIYLGGILGVVMMRFVASFFLRLLERYPRLETAAYLIIAWISVKLGVAAYAHFMHVVRHVDEPVIEHVPDWLFWPVMVALFATGFIGKKTDEPTDGDPDAGAEDDAA